MARGKEKAQDTGAVIWLVSFVEEYEEKHIEKLEPIEIQQTFAKFSAEVNPELAGASVLASACALHAKVGISSWEGSILPPKLKATRADMVGILLLIDTLFGSNTSLRFHIGML